MDEATPVWAERADVGWRFRLHVQPGASRNEVVGVHGDALKVRVRAKAQDGRANAELVRFLAAQLGVARRDVRLVRGASSRSKVVEVAAPIHPDRLLP